MSLISKIIKDSYYISYCYKITGGVDIYKDLYQFIILSVLEMPQDKQQAISEGNFKNYITRMIWLNWKSNTAPFRRTHIFNELEIDRDIEDSIEDIQYSEDTLKIIEDVLEEERDAFHKKKMFPWSVELFKRLVDTGYSYHELANDINIPYSTIRYNMNNLKEKINERISSNRSGINRN